MKETDKNDRRSVNILIAHYEKVPKKIRVIAKTKSNKDLGETWDNQFKQRSQECIL